MEVLLFGAVAAIVALLISAWVLALSHVFPAQFLGKGRIIDFKSFVRGHVDYALMAIFCLAYYGVGIELNNIACWCIAIGAMTNPFPFIVGAFDKNYKTKKAWRVFVMISFIITTIGHGWAAYSILLRAIELWLN